jgi:hypothetical protein
MQLSEHESAPDEKQAHWLRYTHLLQLLTEISEICFDLTRLHSCLPFSAGSGIILMKDVPAVEQENASKGSVG